MRIFHSSTSYLSWLVLLLLCAWAQVAYSASFQANLDRNPISAEEIVTLTLVAENYESNDAPDLSPLEQDFRILSTAQSSSTQIINGSRTQTLSWTLQLAPKRNGELLIPSLTLGTLQSKPVSLKVLTAEQSRALGQVREMFMEAQVVPEKAYVQSQATYILRLYSRYPLLGGNISQLNVPQASLQELGKGKQYQEERDGVRYNVIEQHYALIPESSGTLEIPSVVFAGSIDAPQSRQQNRRMENDVFDSFFNRRSQGKSVRAQAPSISLEVLPKPAEFPDQAAWLAASDIYLSESWQPNPPLFRVGEPVTRSLTLQAKGLQGAQLPTLHMPVPPEIKAYPDQAQVDTQAGEQWLIGQRVEKAALVPTRAGKFTLPELRLPWWNIISQKLEYATLPAQEIEVLPAANAATAPQSPAQTGQFAPPPLPSANTETIVQKVPDAGFWPWLSAVLALLWLATLGLWWQQRRRLQITQAPAQRDPLAPSQNAALQALKQACSQNQPKPIKAALLDWAAARWPEQAILSLPQLAQHVHDAELSRLLSDLDRSLYAHSDAHWEQGAALYSALKNYRHQPPAIAHAGDDGLAPLHP